MTRLRDRLTYDEIDKAAYALGLCLIRDNDGLLRIYPTAVPNGTDRPGYIFRGSALIEACWFLAGVRYGRQPV